MEEFIDNVRILIHALGYKVLEPLLWTGGEAADSVASMFMLGYSVSGPKTRKTKDGRSLKEIEANATGA